MAIKSKDLFWSLPFRELICHNYPNYQEDFHADS